MRFDLGGFLHLVEQFGPIALLAAGVPGPLIPVIVHGIGLAEQTILPGHSFGLHGTGADKKAFVLDTVNTAVAAVNVVKPGTLVVSPSYAEAVSMGIDTTIAIVNLVQRQREVAPAGSATV